MSGIVCKPLMVGDTRGGQIVLGPLECTGMQLRLIQSPHSPLEAHTLLGDRVGRVKLAPMPTGVSVSSPNRDMPKGWWLNTVTCCLPSAQTQHP
jgi:hypothetical protein